MRNILLIVLLTVWASCQTSTPPPSQDPLTRLLEGNRRFAAGKPIHPDETLERLRALKKGQHPFAVVVSCSDSRVPPELIFDQGLGDLFVIRTAGNIIGDYELGSIEYAVEHLDCRTVIVLGHENCGAMQAFVNHSPGQFHDHIERIMEYISKEDEEKAVPDSLKNNLDIVIKANVMHGVHLLQHAQPELAPQVQAGKLKIYGAVYDLDSGEVQLLHEK